MCKFVYLSHPTLTPNHPLYASLLLLQIGDAAVPHVTAGRMTPGGLAGGETPLPFIVTLILLSSHDF